MSAHICSGTTEFAPLPQARLCLPVEEWPPLDLAAWEASCIVGGPLDPGGLASRWAPLTRGVTAYGYGRFLTWLATRDGLDPSAGPADRVNRDVVRSYAHYLETVLSPVTVGSYIQQLFDALRAMTEGQDWRWIMRASWRIREQAIPVRDKRSRLQSSDRLAELGKKIMTAADLERDEDPVEAAIRFRSGLMIAFLAFRPVRAANLAAINCGQHLIAQKGLFSIRLVEVKRFPAHHQFGV